MNSLFFSLEYFVNISQYIIRQEICNYLENNLKYINSMNIYDTPIDHNYIIKLRDINTHGTNSEIQIACDIYNARIILFDNNTEIEYLPTNNNPDKMYKLIKKNNIYKPIFNNLIDNF